MKKALNNYNKLLWVVIALATMWSMQSCTHNGGDIDPWFGTWHVESVTAGGTPVATIEGDFFFQFQNEVVRMSWRNRLLDTAESYGNWTDAGGVLTMSFNDPKMPPLALAGFSTSNALTIERLSDDRIMLSQVVDGLTYRYTIKKVV